MVQHMEIRHLRYFVVAAEEENFHRAAARLNIAQPALSRQIRDMEAEIGAPLFDRVANRVRLSAAGAGFLDQARAILAQLNTAIDTARRTGHGQSGALSIGFNIMASRTPLVSDAVNWFRRAHPQIHLELRADQSPPQIEAIRAGRLDVGFMSFPPAGMRDLVVETVHRDGFLLALPHRHRLARRKQVLLADLRDERFILPKRSFSPALYDTMVLMLQSQMGQLNIVQEVNGEEAILGFVSSGLGLSLVSASTRRAPSDRVAFRPIADLHWTLPLNMVHRRGNRDAALKAFLERVRAAVRP